MRSRRDITNQEVLDLYAKHQNQIRVAGILNCSIRLIYDVLRGTRKNPKPKKPPSLQDVNKPICSACGENPVKKGNRFLCEMCFESGSEFYEQPVRRARERHYEF